MRQPLKPSRHLVPILLLLLLAACGKAPPAQEPVRAVRTTTLDVASAGTQHEYAAEIRARVESRLSFRVSGKMVKRMVEVGSVVKAGQPLAQIDPQDLKLGQEAAVAALNASKVNLDISEAEFKRFKDLREQGFISGFDLDRREATVKSARAQVAQLQAQANAQGNQTNYAVLVSDVGGVITEVSAEPGTVLSAGTPVFRLAQEGPRDAVFGVPEDKVVFLRALLAQPGGVQLKLWGTNDNTTLPATVREVAAAADPTTRTFTIKADVGNAPLRLGQTASVLVASPRIEGVVKLPLAAVFEAKGQSNVWLLDPSSMTVRARRVTIGGAEGNNVVITDGLLAGQTVVTAGVHTLTPGQKVKAYVEPGAAPANANLAGPAGLAASGAAGASAAAAAR